MGVACAVHGIRSQSLRASFFINPPCGASLPQAGLQPTSHASGQMLVKNGVMLPIAQDADSGIRSSWVAHCWPNLHAGDPSQARVIGPRGGAIPRVPTI
jgi:hypothetical protein